jgi:hypothetical protein
MEDTTSNSRDDGNSPTPGPLAINAVDLLISDKVAWQALPPTRSALGCGRGQKLGVSMRNGELVSFFPPCRSYGHKPCAEVNVKGHLDAISRNLRNDRSGWVAVISEEDYDSDLLRDRLYRYRLKHPGDTGAWYRVVKRTDGTRWVMATVPLAGRLPPALMEPVDDLLMFAAEALCLPGVLGFRGTPWPVKAIETGGSDVHSFGSFTDETKEPFLVAVADEVEKQYRVRIDPMDPLEYRNGITFEQYVECGDAVRARG